MIYLAVPIKHSDERIMRYRITTANQVAARLHDAGIPVFSPASHGDGIIKHCLAPVRGWSYWLQIDLPILTECSMLAVLCLDGWQESEGVTAEISEARGLGIEIVYVRMCEWCGEALDDRERHHPWSHAPVPYLGALGVGDVAI